ncbi:PrsW family intramembrane metalloprotease [Propionibacterium freudenreichii]|uniref:PrsW family intramembrane metalloprotease n=1 Tax=Propionibacterium freudenreichii TaxID=1744 RepID=UPI0038548106
MPTSPPTPKAVASPTALERRERRLVGLPAPAVPGRGWFSSALHRPTTWLLVVFFPLCVFLLWRVYLMFRVQTITSVAQATEKAGQRVEPTVGQFNEAVVKCAQLAAISLAIGLFLYFLIDRIHRTGFLLKVICVFWGGAVAVYFAVFVNSWVAALLGDSANDESASTKAAIYVAPFVEEFAKATVLILLAILVRRRLVSAIQVVTLAGLSAMSFAATENITYYLKTYMSAAMVYGQDPTSALRAMFLQRGLLTWWGHPLFTTCTAIGVALAMRNRSKWVRVGAPLAGYLCAATLHMLFNGSSLFFGDDAGAAMTFLLIFGASGVIGLLIRYFIHLRSEGRLVGHRLADFVREGWLDARDPHVFSGFFRRVKLLLAALLRGPRTLIATVRIQRAMIELAYLRASVTWGTVDEAGQLRSRELLAIIRDARGTGLSETDGLHIKPTNWTLRNIRAALGRLIARLRPRRSPGSTPPPAPPPTATPVIPPSPQAGQPVGAGQRWG